MTLPPDISKAFDAAAGHLRDDDIAGYVDNALTPAERQAVDRHLAACPACLAQVEMVAEAVEADISNPSRLDALVERLTATADAPSRSALEELRDLSDRVRVEIRDWIGALLSWSPRPAAAGVAMRDGGSPGVGGYAGVETRLDGLFSKEVLTRELGWAKGSLSLTAAYDDTGQISDLRAAIGVHSQVAEPSPIIVRVGPQGGPGVTLTLTQDRPSAVAASVTLPGPLDSLTVSISVGTFK